MGWRFKKPINFRSGFRLNLSKRGLGVSWGFPMFRTGISSDGRRYIWITVPRTGLSWVKYFGKRANSGPGGPPQSTPQHHPPSVPGQSPAQNLPSNSPLASPQATTAPSAPSQQSGAPWWRQKNI